MQKHSVGIQSDCPQLVHAMKNRNADLSAVLTLILYHTLEWSKKKEGRRFKAARPTKVSGLEILPKQPPMYPPESLEVKLQDWSCCSGKPACQLC